MKPWKIRLPMPVNLSTGKSEVVLMRDNQSDVWDGENIAEVFATSHNTALETAGFIVKAVNEYDGLSAAFKTEFELRKELERKNELLLDALKTARKRMASFGLVTGHIDEVLAKTEVRP